MHKECLGHEPLNWKDRVKYIFLKPNKAFEDIAHFPTVLFPFLTVFIGMLILIGVRYNLFKEYLNMNAQDIAGQTVNAPNVLISIVAFSFLPVSVWIIKSSLIHGFVPLFGGEAKFKQIFSVVAYAYLPVLLGQVIIAIISLATGEFTVIISAAALLPKSMEGDFLFSFLAQFDIFVIWYQILVIIGASHVYDLEKKHTAIPVIGTWLSWVLIISSLQIISSWMIQNSAQ